MTEKCGNPNCINGEIRMWTTRGEYDYEPCPKCQKMKAYLKKEREFLDNEAAMLPRYDPPEEKVIKKLIEKGFEYLSIIEESP